MTVYLVRGAAGEFELYAHPSEQTTSSADGLAARYVARFRARWQAMVDDAQRVQANAASASWWARRRAAIVCRLADTVHEQRTLWALRHATAATLVRPDDMDEANAETVLRALLMSARRHHGWWTVVDAIVFVASGALVLVPGPNLVAYYFAFALLGHYFSWRGARQALDRIAWTIVAGS